MPYYTTWYFHIGSIYCTSSSPSVEEIANLYYIDPVSFVCYSRYSSPLRNLIRHSIYFLIEGQHTLAVPSPIMEGLESLYISISSFYLFEVESRGSWRQTIQSEFLQMVATIVSFDNPCNIMTVKVSRILNPLYITQNN